MVKQLLPVDHWSHSFRKKSVNQGLDLWENKVSNHQTREKCLLFLWSWICIFQIESAYKDNWNLTALYAWFTLVVRIGDFHCLWSLMCKMLCPSEKNTIDRRRTTTSVNQALRYYVCNNNVNVTMHAIPVQRSKA